MIVRIVVPLDRSEVLVVRKERRRLKPIPGGVREEARGNCSISDLVVWVSWRRSLRSAVVGDLAANEGAGVGVPEFSFDAAWSVAVVGSVDQVDTTGDVPGTVRRRPLVAFTYTVVGLGESERARERARAKERERE